MLTTIPVQQERTFFDDFEDSWRDAGRDMPRGMRSMTCCAMAWKASVTLTSALADASMKRTSYSAASAWPSCVDTWRALWLSDLFPEYFVDLRAGTPRGDGVKGSNERRRRAPAGPRGP